MSEKYSVEIARGREALNALRPAWLELLERRRGYAFYHHPQWFGALNDHLLGDELVVAQLWCDGKLQVLAPLISHGAMLSNPRHEHIVLSDWVIADALPVTTLLRYLPDMLEAAGGGRWTRLALHDFVSAELVHGGLSAPADAPAPLLSTLRTTRTSAWFDCRQDATPVPGKMRRNLRRLRKKCGEVSVTVADTPETLAGAYQEFLRIEASGWKGDKKTAIARDEDLRRFYEALQVRTAGLGAEIHILHLDGQAVAAQLTLRSGGLLSLLKIGFDEAYAQVSPGSILLEETLTRAQADPATESVSLVTNPPWAERWHPAVIDVGTCRIYNNTTSGHAKRRVDHLRATAVNLCRELIKHKAKH
ncbi:GNAT family N-acetyltransferase [Granulosicoccaceae sp. 1_MG-2023]|nr:GNAT family N-acetyltransferase [Granulosicoccaceae sp. 1_MG-2023]